MFMSTIIGTPISIVNRNADAFHIDNIDMSIGSRIREARRIAKLTQKALALKVGMAQASLSELETGESQGTTMGATIAAALGVSALWLETGRGHMLPGFDEEDPPEPTPLPDGVHYDIITTEERNLIAMYRAATPRAREMIVLAAERADRELVSHLPRYKGQ